MADVIPTIKVKPWGKGQGGFVEINEEDFDEKVHKLADESDLADARPSDGLTVAELKEALEAKGVAIPEGALKADLAALLDEASAE